jgi:HK97 family phage major capsid protein
VFPSVAGKVLRANITYRVSLAGSIEAETDVPGSMAKMSRAMGVAFARKLGADAINGGGGTGVPNGITNGLSSVYTTGSGKITYNDLSSIYFSVNRVYRSSPKCGWLMSDSVYERVRNSTDNNGRPILDFLEDRETILGRPVYISPTLGQVGGSLALNSTIVFGDLSHFLIRCSKPTIARELNSATKGIEFGEALYVGRMRMDSVLFDPSSGSAPPVVISTVTS